jgi:hypothetical protein
VVYGTPPVAMAALPTARDGRWLSLVASLPLVVLVLLLGIHVPEEVSDLLRQVASVVTPVVSGDIR